MEEPQEVQDEEYERVWERVAAVDVAKASGVVCTRVPDEARPGRRRTKVWTVTATLSAVTELADHLRCHQIEVVTLESTGVIFSSNKFSLNFRRSGPWRTRPRRWGEGAGEGLVALLGGLAVLYPRRAAICCQVAPAVRAPAISWCSRTSSSRRWTGMASSAASARRMAAALAGVNGVLTSNSGMVSSGSVPGADVTVPRPARWRGRRGVGGGRGSRHGPARGPGGGLWSPRGGGA